MGSRVLTAGSVVVPVGDRGVVFTSCEGFASSSVLLEVRSSGVSLEVLGVLQALLGAGKLLGARKSGNGFLPLEGSVELVVPEVLVPVLREVCASGMVSVPEAGGVLSAFASQWALLEAAGVSLRLVPGAVSPSAGDALEISRLAERVEGELRVLAERTAAWCLPVEDAVWVTEHAATIVYTDGSCTASTGFSSWAWWCEDGRSGSGTCAASSSSYAERRAVLEALRAVDGPVLVVSDFSDLVPPVSARVRASREVRVLKALRRMVGSRQVRFLTVKGHDVCPGNLAADRLAGEARSTVWARLSHDALLVERLVGLSEAAKVELRLRRAAANERRTLHEERYGPDPERRRARRARLVALSSRGLLAS